MVRQRVDVSLHSQPTRHTGNVGALNKDGGFVSDIKRMQEVVTNLAN